MGWSMIQLLFIAVRKGMALGGVHGGVDEGDRRSPNPPAPHTKPEIASSSVALIPRLRDYTRAAEIPDLSWQRPANALGVTCTTFLRGDQR